MEIRTDLHDHLTTFVEDLSDMAPRGIKRARQMLGPGGILGVINAQDKGLGRYETFIRGLNGYKLRNIGNAVHVKDLDIYVIKGQEVFTENGHILVIGLDESVKLQDYKSLEESLDEAERYNGVIILDHPFFLDGVLSKNLNRVEEILKRIDGIEVHNGEAWLPIPGIYQANREAQEFYDKITKNYLIGALSASDGHSLSEIGSSYTVLEQPDFTNEDSLRETLRASIKNHRDNSQDKKTNSIIPTIEHAMKVASLRLASKFGLIERVN